MTAILMAIFMGILAGPTMALAINSSTNRRGYEIRKAKFEAGEGKNPDLSPFGPHKSFKQNAVIFGLMFAVLGFFLGSMA